MQVPRWDEYIRLLPINLWRTALCRHCRSAMTRLALTGNGILDNCPQSFKQNCQFSGVIMQKKTISLVRYLLIRTDRANESRCHLHRIALGRSAFDDISFARHLVEENYLRCVKVGGVNVSRLFGSEDMGVSGRLLRTCSTKQNVLMRTFSVSFCVPRMSLKTFLVLWTRHSQAKPLSASRMSSWRFQFSMHEINSMAEPTKFVPLSDQMTKDVPAEQ